ncbi:MAG: acyltransferase [Bacteroidia bacterium]
MLKENKSTYLPNLDGLRFLGSLFIILFHIENLKMNLGTPVINWFAYFHPLGNLDVTLFFVLSGFIITYLLLKEKERTETINLKNFYIRRILKIWPLYFFIVFIGLFVLPHFDFYFYHDYSTCVGNHFSMLLVSCLFFFPPLIQSLHFSIGAIWTIRVEEFFYLFWPILLKNKKNYMKLFFIVIGISLVLRNGYFVIILMEKYFHVDFFYLQHSAKKIFNLTNQYRVSTMAIGGIGAYLVVFDKQKILSFIYKKQTQWIVYFVTLVLLCAKIHIPIIHWEFYSVLFTIIIVNLATNPNSILKLDYPWMNYLGKISYGLYLYNPIMRILSLELVEHLFRADIIGWQMNALYYFFTIISTILISMLSYHVMEKPFLNLKKRFSPAKNLTVHSA